MERFVRNYRLGFLVALALASLTWFCSCSGMSGSFTVTAATFSWGADEKEEATDEPVTERDTEPDGGG